ncbi:hypothetical protein FNL56_07945 [Tardiphaga sp. vice304]|nr:hypothetical protein FNL56_07945 [Tardiphaga sp. vice304]
MLIGDMPAGQSTGPLEGEADALPAAVTANEAPSGRHAAAGVPPVGLRPPFVTPAAAHSHPDCRGILILIVALHRGIARALEMSKPRSIDAHFLGEKPSDWEHAHLLWRSVPAHRFHRDHRAAVNECMRRTSSTMEIWRLAIAGDPASAINLALNMDIPDQITIRTDLTMTVLLHNVLRGSSGAALVLSNLIRRMPIDRVDRRRFATSWLAHNFRDAWPELDERLRRSHGDGENLT